MTAKTRSYRKATLKWRAPSQGKNKGKIVAICRNKIVYVLPDFRAFLMFKEGWDGARNG